MSHQAMLGDVEVPVTFSKDEAVGLMQEAGIVGAGGAGFPTYVKYMNAPQTLVVNAAESEPGYYADKLIMQEEPEALIDVFTFMKQTFSMENMIIGAETVAKPYMAELEFLARELHNFSISWIDPVYKYGQERALVKAMFGMEIPPKEIPAQHGVAVNNVETLFNVYRATFRDRPVRTKFMHLYGEDATPARCYETPIGTLADDLFEIHGIDRDAIKGFRLYDGGPVLADKKADPIGDECLVPVTRTTNAFLVVHPDKDRPRKKHYPAEDFDEFHNSIDAPWAIKQITNVENEIERVRVPLKANFWTGGPVVVKDGDFVERDAVLSHPITETRSVGVHASIPGRVTAVTEEYVEIHRE